MVFNYAHWEQQLDTIAPVYQKAGPFPNCALDKFLDEDALKAALSGFPGPDSEEWISYTHVNEKKYGRNDLESFTPEIRKLFEELNSERFVGFLQKLTGIHGLFADPDLEGGGMHQTPKGGYLNMHADFTVHPHHMNWQRRVNLLVYLNESWDESYGGKLELWDKQMKNCEVKIAPVFNRAVIFNTDQDSFHGHPDPLNCPEGMTRKSIALYYFTEEEAPVARSTEYRARPRDGNLKRFMIVLDKWVLRAYDRGKRIFGFDDRLASAILRFFSGK